MNLEAKKLEQMKWLAGITDKTILQKVAEVKTSSISSGLPLISIEELQARALRSEEAIKQGNVITFEDFKEEIKNW